MIKEPRYEIKDTGFGPNFYDAGDDRDLTLADVLALLNDMNESHPFRTWVHKETFECERQKRIRFEEIAIGVHQALVKAGIELKAGHNDTLRWGVESLTAERNALAADLEREQQGALELRKRHGARGDESIFAFIDRLAGEKVPLQAANDALRSDLEELDERLGRERDDERRRRVYYRNIVEDVCSRLNTALGGHTVPGDPDSPTTQVVERLNQALHPHEYVFLKYHDDVVAEAHRQQAELDAQLTEARNVLTSAGVGSLSGYGSQSSACGRERSVAERINILARRSWSHEDPARTAYIAALERAAQSVLSTINDGLKRVASTEFALALEQLHEATRDRPMPTGLVTRAFHDGAVNTLKDELRTARAEINKLRNYKIEDGESLDLASEVESAWREWAQRLTGLGTADDDHLRRAIDRLHDEGDGLRSELAIYINKAERFAREADGLRDDCRDLAARKEGGRPCSVCGLPCYECDATPAGYLCARCAPGKNDEELRAANKHMRDKLVRIVEKVPLVNRDPVLGAIKEIATEQLPPGDPAMVELERANMLVEIDDVLSKAGCWVGGRLDSIEALVARRRQVTDLRLAIANVLTDDQLDVQIPILGGRTVRELWAETR
jgi:hypothetical protein